MSRAARIRAWLAEQSEPRGTAAVARALGLTSEQASMTLAVMYRDGLVTRTGTRKPYAFAPGRPATPRAGHEVPRVRASRAEARAALRRARGVPTRAEYLAQLAARPPAPRARTTPRPTAPRPVRAVPLRPLPPPKPAQPPLPSVAAWLEAGGQIEQLPRGACSQPLRFDHGDRR